jgi:hypothetical protein
MTQRKEPVPGAYGSLKLAKSSLVVRTWKKQGAQNPRSRPGDMGQGRQEHFGGKV